MKVRKFVYQALDLTMLLLHALMFWNFLKVCTGTIAPGVVIVSASMEPAFYRGDIVFLTNLNQPYRAGDVCVFTLAGRGMPIVHRIIKVHEKPSGFVEVLTKGDNNAVDDRGLYSSRDSWVHADAIIGRAKGYVPYIGMICIVLLDYPLLKYFLFVVCGLMVMAPALQPRGSVRSR